MQKQAQANRADSRAQLLRTSPNKQGDRGANFFFSSRRRHTRLTCDWSSDVCSSDLRAARAAALMAERDRHSHPTTSRKVLVAVGGQDIDAETVRLALRMTDPQGGRLYGVHIIRSEERRVGKECRSRWSPYLSKKKTE